ncbi:MAG TPA: metal ABC transporter substrate-binding protein [Bacillota bacterium]|nr:metal ABC transporter substrate-binding protein [Bacillota bacterium]HPT87226.1 metal ABC transporter substrate-binding protein [Bacillota bacterium]
MAKRWLWMSFIGLACIICIWAWVAQRETGGESGSQIKVSVSMPILKYLTERIGGSEVSVTSIINGPNCNHEYEPTTGDLKQVAASDLYIRVGMGFDRWVDQLVANAAGGRMLVIDASQGITALVEDEEDHHEEADEDDHNHFEENPHYWGNPDHVLMMAENIMKGLSKIAPDKQSMFEENYRKFKDELNALVNELKERISGLNAKPVVSYSAAFPYLFEAFGINNVITVESTCEQEVSPKRLVEVARVMRQNRIRVLIGEMVYPELPKNLAEETGAQVVLLWPATNESGDYLATLKENIEKLVEALK